MLAKALIKEENKTKSKKSLQEGGMSFSRVLKENDVFSSGSVFVDPKGEGQGRDNLQIENKDLSLLLDAARDVSAEDLKTVYTMLLDLKNKEQRGD